MHGVMYTAFMHGVMFTAFMRDHPRNIPAKFELTPMKTVAALVLYIYFFFERVVSFGW